MDRKQSLAYFGDLNRAVRDNLKVTAVTPSNYKHMWINGVNQLHILNFLNFDVQCHVSMEWHRLDDIFCTHTFNTSGTQNRNHPGDGCYIGVLLQSVSTTDL